VPASGLIRSGRIPVEIGNHADTGIAFANPGSTPATVTFYFTDGTGNDTARQSVLIPAGGQMARFLSEAPFNAPQMQRSFTFDSNVDVSVIALRGFTNERSEFLITTLPVAVPNQPVSGTTVIPHYAEGGGWSTKVMLLNPTDSAISGNVQFVNPSGSTTGGEAYQIPPRSVWMTTKESSSSEIVTGSIEISPSGTGPAPVGLAIFRFRPDNVTVSETGVAAHAPGSSFVTYAETMNGLRSGVAIWNGSSNPENIRLELFKLDGTSTGMTSALAVPARGQRALFLNEVPGFESLADGFQGVLRVYTEPQAPISVIALRGRTNERQEFIVSTMNAKLESEASPNPSVFPHIVDGGGYSTQFLLIGPAADIKMFTQTGATMNLPVQ
jgi:hypothetical protein